MKNKRINNLPIIDIPTQSEIEQKKLRFLIIKSIIIAFLILSCFISLFIAKKTSELSDKLPQAEFLKEYKPDQSTLIYDINNKLVANIHGDEDREIVPLSKISSFLKYAVISIEDNRFYEHNGVDLTGTLRAGISDLSGKGDSIQGGSTLTQQLVKNSFLSPERSLKRKILEAILAIEVEKEFDKNKILEMYLNQIYWGNRSYGAEKAALRYFNIPASQLDLAQSALLAGLIRAPEGYSPYMNYKKSKNRQKLVLEKMEYYGYITKNQRISAENENLKFSSRKESYPYISVFY